MKNVIRTLRRKVREARGLDLKLPIEAHVPHVFVGSEYGGWDVARVGLPASPTIFSIGLGRDISFDLAAIQTLNARIFGFDPTPKSKSFIESQQLPSAFKYVPVGIAAYDGVATFRLPRSDFDSYSTESTPDAAAADVVNCGVKRLATLARELDITSIDILKMDIEGGEYDVVPDVLASGIPIGQLMVELHYEPHNAQFEKAKRLIEQVRAAGFRLFARSPVGRELSFVHERLLKA